MSLRFLDDKNIRLLCEGDLAHSVKTSLRFLDDDGREGSKHIRLLTRSGGSGVVTVECSGVGGKGSSCSIIASSMSSM